MGNSPIARPTVTSVIFPLPDRPILGYNWGMEAKLNKHIELRAKKDGAMRPFVFGTKVEIQYIVKDHEWHGMDPEEIARGYDNVSIAQVYAALAYYHDNRDDIRQMMREDEAIVQNLQNQLDGSCQGDSTDAASSTLPS
jgi:uncharacterized protein (DUF433 family)